MDLIQSEIEVLVAEPWDFASSDGPNILRGVVLSASGLQATRQWVLCRVAPFTHDGSPVNYVVIAKRYHGEPVLDALVDKGECGCNCVFSPNSKIESGEDVERLLDDSTAPFLAGRASLRHRKLPKSQSWPPHPSVS